MDEELNAEAAAEAVAQAEAEKAAVEAQAAKDAEAANKEAEKRISDAEAKLLKENMRLKKQKEELEAKAKEFEGLNAAELRQLQAEKADRERKEAEARGEYDRVLKQIREENEARLKAQQERQAALEAELAAKQNIVDELTIGSAFRGSEFLSKNTILSGEKARVLYGAYFDIKDGAVVAYDKPRGAAERTPLVDASGDYVKFEEALEKIMRADADFERFQLSKLKRGSGSEPSPTSKATEQKKPTLFGRDLIAANLKPKK